VRGAELLGRADVVVYDALVNPELLRLAPRSAEIVFGGKRAGAHVLSQQELNQMLIAKAREGKTVVRLKGGDPYVFGRGGEEAEQLADAGIPFEVVPGVSSFVAVPNYAGVPLTHRDCCSRLTLLTGHDDPARESESIDWAHLAKTPGTKVIMMGTNASAKSPNGSSPRGWNLRPHRRRAVGHHRPPTLGGGHAGHDRAGGCRKPDRPAHRGGDWRGGEAPVEIELV
jgi:uroporphyrin-III C-methyltransferase